MNQTMMPFRQVLFTRKILTLLAALMLGGAQMKEADAAARISVLDNDSCAIAADGRVQCWGNNAAYAGAGPGRAMEMTGFPADVVGLTGSTLQLCALTADGGLWCQGNRPGDGSEYSAALIVPTGMASGVADVGRSYQQVCVAKDDGSVWCWGFNNFGLGDGSVSALVPVQVLPPAFGAAGVAVGIYHTCAWSQSGQGYCWGYNQFGQLGTGSSGGSEALPVAVAGLTGIQSMTVSHTHTCALVGGGDVYCWGSNDFRQLGDGTYTNSATPVLATQLNLGANQDVFAGNDFTCAQPAAGALVCDGAGFTRQTAASGVLEADAGQVALGNAHGCALVDGRAHCWGRNDFGETGNGRFGNEYAPVKLLNGGFAHAPGVAAEEGCAVRQDGGVSCWGGSFVQPPYVHAPVAGIGGQAGFLGRGDRYQCVLRDDAKVLCWGDNWYGMLGDGTTDHRNSPTPLAGISQDVNQLSVGMFHSCAVLADASVVCWGNNFNGQAGGGDFQNRLVPGPVSGLADVVQVDAGWTASCAVNVAGQVWCWGSNEYGLLGPDATEPTAIPVQIQGLPALAQRVSVGYMHACAVLQDGRIACWGYGGSGQLGQGEFTYTPTLPVLVASDESFVQVVTGSSHTCARSSADDVFCWGSSSRGQLGIGPENRFAQSTPTAVALKAVDLAAAPGADATCALDAQGDAWCWGANEYAQLGIGRRGVREVPGPVMGAGEEIFVDGFEP